MHTSVAICPYSAIEDDDVASTTEAHGATEYYEQKVRGEVERWGHLLQQSMLERIADACDLTEELRISDSPLYRRSRQGLQRLYADAITEATALTLRYGSSLTRIATDSGY